MFIPQHDLTCQISRLGANLFREIGSSQRILQSVSLRKMCVNVNFAVVFNDVGKLCQREKWSSINQ